MEEILAQEEVAAEQEEQPEEVPVPQDESEAFTLDDVMVDEEDEEEEEDEELPFEDLGDEIWEVPQLTPDAGKIRFAEDILDFERGGGGRSRRGRSKRKAKARRR